jgi:hypothetical protein
MELVKFKENEHRRSLWNRVACALYIMSCGRLLINESPDVKLLLAIIIQAGYDRDTKFFKSFMFTYLCDILELNQNFTFECMQKTWTHYDILKTRREARK